MDISNCNNYNVPINSIEYEIKKKKIKKYVCNTTTHQIEGFLK